MARIRSSLIGVAMCLYASPPLLAAEVSLDERITWIADVLTSDFRQDTIDLTGNVRVQQGALSIEAGAANAVNVQSDNSRWTFKDQVRIRTAQADLQSDTATAAFLNEEIVRARAEGSPAQFERRGDPDRQVRGRAGVIEYDFAAGLVRLQDQVWFTNGKDEFRGDVVIYNVRDERIQINPGGRSGRVRGVIRPATESNGGGASVDADSPDAVKRDENGA